MGCVATPVSRDKTHKTDAHSLRQPSLVLAFAILEVRELVKEQEVQRVQEKENPGMELRRLPCRNRDLIEVVTTVTTVTSHTSLHTLPYPLPALSTFVPQARDRAGEGLLLGKAARVHGTVGRSLRVCALQEDENVAVDPEALQRLAKEPVILKMLWQVYSTVCNTLFASNPCTLLHTTGRGLDFRGL